MSSFISNKNFFIKMSYKQPDPKIFDNLFKNSEFFKKNFNFNSGKGIIQLDVKIIYI